MLIKVSHRGYSKDPKKSSNFSVSMGVLAEQSLVSTGMSWEAS